MSDSETMTLRESVLKFLTASGKLDDDYIVVGFGMVVEVLDTERGRRAVMKVTSDPAGETLPWYLAEALSIVMRDCNEYDEEDEDD